MKEKKGLVVRVLEKTSVLWNDNKKQVFRGMIIKYTYSSGPNKTLH